MDYSVKNGNIILRQPDLDLDQTLDCGQAFRWEKIDDNTYTGFFLRTPLTVSAEGDIFVFHNVSEREFLDVWADYFDLNCDYGELKRRFSEDKTMSEACAYAPGIRLLKQDTWEALISFIISQNNNIPRIKGIIGRLCDNCGGFPDPSDLKGVTAEELAYLRAGFRGKYLADCCEKVNSGVIKLDDIRKMPLADARKALMTIKGVGPKVADCVLLFGMYRTEAFPVDVWIKRVMEQYYPNGLPDCVKGYEGIAQQYLFHYMRTKIGN